MLLATLEKALLALEPIKRTVPTTSTKITASIDSIFGNILTLIIRP